MATKKHIKIKSVIIALLSCVMLVCSSAVTAFANNTSFADIVAQYDAFVQASGVLTEGDAFQSLNDLVNPDEAVKIEQANAIIELALSRAEFLEGYSDENIDAGVEPASRADVKAIRDAVLAIAKIEGAKINGVDWEAYIEDIYDRADLKALEILEIIFGDMENFDAFQNAQAGKVNEVYKNLIAKTLEGVGDENTVVGFYSPAQEQELKSIFEGYVKVTVNGDGEEKCSFVQEIEYKPATVIECKAKAEALAEEAINALKGVAVNDIEVAYNLYMDWLALADTYSETEYNEVVEQLKTLATKAINVYENKASEEIKAKYSSEYTSLSQFIANIDGYADYVPVRVSTLKDEKGVFTIVAKYENGEVAEVLPENCELFIYATSNGAIKRNASTEMKAIDKNLSVAYLISFRVVRNFNNYKLPTEHRTVVNGVENVKAVEYEVTVDLEKYYEEYCKDAQREENKLQNIVDAQALIANIADASLCYGYQLGKIEKLDATLEGGVLVFKTTTLNNLCIAGEGLGTILNNPLYLVLIGLGALVLIIIIWKIIAKHAKYAIRFNSNGGSQVKTIRASKNEYFIMPEAPVKESYVFAGWYTDKELTSKFLETYMRRRKSIKLYAKWVSSVSEARLIEMYDTLRDEMRSCKKESFKPLLGLVESELLATMYFKETHIQLNLALNPEALKKEGVNVIASKEKRFAEIPAQINISTEEHFATALQLVKRVILAKGLQKVEDYEAGVPSTAEERKNGFTYSINNERVASTAEDYFELLRIALKSYVMEEDNGMFKPGDKLTLARIYITNEVACLHLPALKGDKAFKPAADARFEDTPVIVKILAPRDILEAYDLIDKVMTANGFTKCPENANDLQDVKVPETNGFAYTIVF